MKVLNFPQGSAEWKQARLGIPTASEFDSLISPKWEIRTGQGPTTYLCQKICERFLGAYKDDGSSFAMNNGSILEHEALPWFEFTHEIKVDRVGFCTTDDGKIGCSPDGLIGEDGGIEIKCPQPENHLRFMFDGVLPKEYAAQVHGSMFVTGRKFWYFMSYSRQFPALLLRVERDDGIQAAIRLALADFTKKLESKYGELKAQKDAENALKNAAYAASEGRL